ncbi:aminotransferase class V-fold PLP-dependent enzyme [Intestinibacter bartlettii]|uniref:aminotransferase class V-fold PLP-dependent enzyme n=1 Tax=Intestinibacter bartlettii TaxID=261299 RepID=UPI0006C2C8B9|nr:aminotransferase class V-fold PLP-dependent enzyme [Intestinibacter bartlettii]MCC2706572.1 aminotransferase class V-fold PLP-dependent enzyme [Intestinibacter bartlettii]MCC2762021.1 aminotransferase class V-fold PLP-dependent enzyme [Intestinibacter bartlettii]MDU6473215.1 aminotransferase class V-fold PLP-dependent enzyme [Intestinibacter bartlettii]CUO66095.1 cysteine desulfurase-like protein [Intestinibacter bartlettii]
MGIYLDNAATSFPKPKEVATAVYDFMVNNGTSSGRGSYKKAMQSDYIVYECRKLIGKLFNFDNPKKVVLTSNVTDSLNIAMRGILKENDHVITSSLEHNAVWRCLKTLERDINIKIDTVECSKDGITNPQDIKKYIKKDTALIVFTQASNVLGTIQPIREIGAIAREHNIPFLVDSAQSAGAMKIDVKEDNIDILAFTGHKSLLGPMGTGGLIINTDIDIKPLKAGGTGGDSAYEYQPDYYPNHLETGTSNVSGIAGLREAIKFLNKEGIENIHNKEKELTKYALEKLETVKDIEIYGPKDCEKMLSVISFNIKYKRPEDVGSILDQKYDIMLRAGLHCAPTAHSVIGTKDRGTLRIGLGYFNKKEDIDKLVEALNNL